ncbi:MAG: riboflavin biosynthesis protein RibF [Prevotella sp.]|nr:riboflavin biosynthesis protein RibF [Prevotella sp.]
MKNDGAKCAYCATTGFFDGVHKGHQYILRSLIADARAHDMLSAAVTFRQHPRQVLQHDYVPKLLTLRQRRERLLLATGVDRVVMLDFTPAFAAQTAADFMLRLRDEYNVRRLLIGYDHRFGHNREEGFEDYQRIGERIGIEVPACKVFTENNTNISSSVVRRLIAAGNIALANEYLGYRYTFDGVVVRGRGEGRKIGFPTANMCIDAGQLIPRRGVYGTEITIPGHGRRLFGMMNIGCRPTYGGDGETVEVNIFDFDEDIYGQCISVSLFLRLRDERKFDSVAALIGQLKADREHILNALRQ